MRSQPNFSLIPRPLVWYRHTKVWEWDSLQITSLLSYLPSLSPSLSLHYSKVKPLKILSGKGQYLYDENEQPYLDCINNVTHGMLYACWAQKHSYTPHQYSNQKLVSVSACVLLFHLLPSLFLPLLPSLSSLPSSLLSPFPHSLSLPIYTWTSPFCMWGYYIQGGLEICLHAELLYGTNKLAVSKTSKMNSLEIRKIVVNNKLY